MFQTFKNTFEYLIKNNVGYLPKYNLQDDDQNIEKRGQHRQQDDEPQRGRHWVVP